MKLLRIFVWAAICVLLATTARAQNTNEQKFKLAESFEKSGDYKGALRLYAELAESNILNENYFNAAVRSAKALNEFTEIIPLIEKRLKTRENVGVRALYAEMLWRTGSSEQADAEWAKALAQARKDQKSYSDIAETQIAVKQYAKAIQTYEKGRDALGSRDLFADELSQLHIAVGNYDKAIFEALIVFDKTQNYQLVEGRLSALLVSNESKEHIRARLEERSADGHLGYLRLLSWFLTMTKEFDKALEVIIRTDKAANSQGYEVYTFAENARRDNHLAAAEKAYSYLIDQGKKNPYSIHALFGYAQVMENKFNSDTSANPQAFNGLIERYRSIIRDYPNTPQADECRYRIASIHAERLSDYESALAELKYVSESKSSPPQNQANAVLYSAKIQTLRGDLNAANDIYRNAIKRFGRSIPSVQEQAQYGIAELRFFSGDADSAKTLFAALSSAKSTDVANKAIEKVIILEQNKDYNRALSLLGRAALLDLQKKADSLKATYLEIIRLAADGDLGEQCYLKVASLEYSRRHYDSTLFYANDLMAKYPETIHGDEALILIGDTYTILNKKDLAMKSFMDLLAKYPRSIYLGAAREKIRRLRGEIN